MKSKSLAIAFVVLMLGTMPLYAAVDAFIWFEGVAGESTDAKHRDWIELESFSAGPSLQAATAGGAAKLAQFHEFTFTRKYDASSPKLMKLLASGKHFPAVTISCRKAGGDPHEYLDFKLENVMVSSYQMGAGAIGGGNGPGPGPGPHGASIGPDRFTLTFSKVSLLSPSPGAQTLAPVAGAGALAKPTATATPAKPAGAAPKK